MPSPSAEKPVLENVPRRGVAASPPEEGGISPSLTIQRGILGSVPTTDAGGFRWPSDAAAAGAADRTLPLAAALAGPPRRGKSPGRGLNEMWRGRADAGSRAAGREGGCCTGLGGRLGLLDELIADALEGALENVVAWKLNWKRAWTPQSAGRVYGTTTRIARLAKERPCFYSAV